MRWNVVCFGNNCYFCSVNTRMKQRNRIAKAMSRQQLDKLDCQILEMLAANARVPFLEIARECGVSGASVHQRIQKLTAMGVVRGFETLIVLKSICSLSFRLWQPKTL